MREDLVAVEVRLKPGLNLSDDERQQILDIAAEAQQKIAEIVGDPRVDALRAALEPFAKDAETYDAWSDEAAANYRLALEPVERDEDFTCTVADLRRARDALR
jgi:hypothetical protein